jgi:hypothetical protein
MRTAVVSAWLLAGCLDTGSLDLALTMPTEPELKPTGMTTITVLATSPEIPPIANRTVLTGNSFKAGELPVADNVQINVLLHDVSNRLVGLGEAPQLIDIVGDKKTSVTIPVRRPFIYASATTMSGPQLFTYDPTLDPRNIKFQGKISGVAPTAGVSVGGDKFVVAGGTSLQVIETSTHKVVGSAITLPGVVNDLAPVPGAQKVAVAHAGGIAIVDLAKPEVTNAAVGMVDRVTVGPAGDGRMVAYGLIGRVAPVENPLMPCMGSSSVVAVFVDSPTVTAPKPLGAPVSGIASAPAQAAVFAALPCKNEVARIDGDPTSEVAQLMLTKMKDLPNAAAVAVLGDRVYAAGTKPSSPVCNMPPCSSMHSTACPETSNTRVAYIVDGARLVLQSFPIAGGEAVTIEFPQQNETMIDMGDGAKSHAQVLHPFGTVPVDIVALPGGQYVSIVTRNNFYIESAVDMVFGVILPCLKTTTADWLLVDMASSSIAQRVRTHCTITAKRMGALFPNWECDVAPEGEGSMQGDYVPTSVGALFGAR